MADLADSGCTASTSSSLPAYWPKILRPTPNRDFPLPFSALIPSLDRANAASVAAIVVAISEEKSKFLYFGSPAAIATNIFTKTKTGGPFEIMSTKLSSVME